MPGTLTVADLILRWLGTLVTEASPLSCKVAVMMPTGVSMR